MRPEIIPNEFVEMPGGRANRVYLSKNGNLVLKKYRDAAFYERELMAFCSGFKRMPEFVSSGIVGDAAYILMTHIGEPVNSLAAREVPAVAETLVLLHRITSDARVSPTDRFAPLLFQRDLIASVLDTDIERLFELAATASYCGVLTHGDLDEGNMRITTEGIYFIDFDECRYSTPYVDLAKAAWSLTDACGPREFSHMLAGEYERIGGMTFDRACLDAWTLLAGIDRWLWRRQNSPENASETERIIREYLVT